MMCFFGRLESTIGMFQRLQGELVSSLVILFPVVRGGTVGVCSEFVKFRSLLVRVIWHSVPLLGSTSICFPSICFAV